MRPIVIFAIIASISATPSAAQSGPVAQQSSDQIICQLSGDCAKTGDATRDKPDSRGFSIRRSGPKPATATIAVATPLRSGVPAASRIRTQAAQPTATGRLSTTRPGRADLMVSFLTGSAELTDQARVNAQQFVVALAAPQLSGMRFAIEGHTDAVGDRAYNLNLSQQRAQSVVDFLASNGADRSRFTVRGYGFDKPLVPKNPRNGANRRVEVVKAN